MSDIKIIIGAEIKELETKLAIAKAKLADLGQVGPRSIGPLQDRLKGLTFPTAQLDNFGNKFKGVGAILQSTGILASAAVAGIGVAIATASKWFDIVKKDFISVGNAAAESAMKIKEYNDLINSVTASVAKESTEIIGLLSVLNNETETRKRKLDTIEKLQKLQPEIFKGLKLEKDAVIGLDEAYVAYLANLRSVIAAKLIQAQIEAKVTELLKIQGAENTKDQQAQLDTLKNLINTNATLAEVKKGLQDTKLAGGFLTDKQTAAKVRLLNDEIKGLFEKLTEFSKTIRVKEIKVKPEKVKIEKPDKIDFDSLKTAISLPELDKPELTIKPNLTIVPNKVEVKMNSADQEKMLKDIEAFFEKERIRALAEEFSRQVKETIQTIATDLASGIGDAIGTAFNGGKNVIPNLFGNLMSSVGQQIQELGKFLIKSGIQMKIAKEAFQKLLANPLLAVAVGVGLVALGALIKSQAQKQYKGFASGVRSLSEGGFYDVGERGRERIFLPQGSSVQPNNELNAFSGGGVTLMPSIEYSGVGFRIMLNRVDAQMGRNN